MADNDNQVNPAAAPAQAETRFGVQRIYVKILLLKHQTRQNASVVLTALK